MKKQPGYPDMNSPANVQSSGGATPACDQTKDVPPEMASAYRSGVNWCCDGGEISGSPFESHTPEHRFFRAGWTRQDAEIRKFGRIL